MNLQDFITQALVQISAGIAMADDELSKHGAIINPRHVVGAGHDEENVYGHIPERTLEMRRAVHCVDFDVAVTVNEGKETKGGIGVVAGVFALGSQGKSDESSQSVSRLKFRIPVALPNSKQRA